MSDRAGRRDRRAAPPWSASASALDRRVTIGVASRLLRRSVGPSAWIVLEELLLTAEPQPDGDLAAAVNVRELAGLTGMSKDTVAGALRRLLTAGVVVRSYDTRRTGGVFPTVRYLLRDERLAGVTFGPRVSTARVRRGGEPAGGQAALFELGEPRA